MNVTDMYILKLGDRNCRKNESDHKAKTVTVRVEELFKQGKHVTEYCTDDERCEYLDKRLNNDGDKVCSAAANCLCCSKKYREDDKTYRVIERNDGQKK